MRPSPAPDQPDAESNGDEAFTAYADSFHAFFEDPSSANFRRYRAASKALDQKRKRRSPVRRPESRPW
jgi:hypothetical protein